MNTGNGEKMLGISPCENDHPFLWAMFCVFMIVATLGIAGLALLATKLPDIKN